MYVIPPEVTSGEVLAAFQHDAPYLFLGAALAAVVVVAADLIISSVQQWALKQDDDFTVLVCDYVNHANQTAAAN